MNTLVIIGIVICIIVIGLIAWFFINKHLNEFKQEIQRKYEKITKDEINKAWNEHIAKLGEKWRDLKITDDEIKQRWDEHIRRSADNAPKDISTVEFFKDLAAETIIKPANMSDNEFYEKSIEIIEKLTGLSNEQLYHFKPIMMLNSLQNENEKVSDEDESNLEDIITHIRKQQYNSIYLPFAQEFQDKKQRTYNNYLDWCVKNNNIPVSIDTFNKLSKL